MLTAEFKKKALEELKAVSPERMVEIFVEIGSVKMETKTILPNGVKDKIIYSGRDNYVFNKLDNENWQDPIGESAA